MAPPPGYVAYGGPGSVGPTKRVGGLAKAITIVLGASALATLIVLVLQLAVAGSAQDFLDGTIGESDFEDDLAPYVLMTLVGAAVSIASIVLLIVWSYRIASNLQAMGRQITWKPGLTIVVWILGGCTLSIINFLMLREHDKASDPASPPGDPSWKQRAASALITVWFVLTLGQVVLALSSGINGVGGVSFGNTTTDLAESFSDNLPLVVASGLVGVASSVTLILVVRALTERHRHLTHES